MKQGVGCILFLIVFFHLTAKSQDNLYTSYTTAAARNKLYKNLINNSINKNLSVALNDSTEDKWEEGFSSLELLLFRSEVIDKKIKIVFDSIQFRSRDFQRALLELAYANYPSVFEKQVTELLQQTNDPKIFAMAAEYLLQRNKESDIPDSIKEIAAKKFYESPDNPFITMLDSEIREIKFPSKSLIESKNFTDILNNKFLPGEIVMYSFQRKNRDYPGIVIIRGRDGKFIKDSSGNIFNVPQLARSISNLPGYLTNGNTPQGIFWMHGFDVSLSPFIGPSPNIQLSLPFEVSPQKFFNDSTVNDTAWTKQLYSKLLPKSFKNYFPMYQSYYAGMAGRTEIIAHGTTVNPEYYNGKPYYPLTPTQGCLCTKEIWNGKRIETDQQKLVYALLKAGGAYGYCVVMELDNKQQPVNINELIPIIQKSETVK
ncbi:MAG: hypothetical protein M3004_12870 [Bacteroidota bacterium]|nr:hypothetical protein [Bacteroidota bacterium]